MVTGIIVFIIAIGAIWLAWQFAPLLIQKAGEVYSLDVLHKLMLFICILFAVFLCWIGMPAFSATVKFFMFGRNFEDLFKWWVFKTHAKQMGEILFWIATFGLWLAVNGCEQYPKILKGNRKALETMLISRQSAKKVDNDPTDDAETLMLKRSIRKLPGFNMTNATIICFVAFVIDTAIAVFNTPVLKPGGDWATMFILGDYDKLDFNNVGILALLIAGMSFNAIVFEQFSSGEKVLNKKVRTE